MEIERALEHFDTVAVFDPDIGHAGLVRPIALLRQVLQEQAEEQVGLAASGAAFWVVIAILPTAIAAVTIYGLAVSPETVADSLAGVARNGPQSLGATFAQQLQKVAAADSGGLTVGLVASVVLALWSASAGVYGLQRAIRAAYGLEPEGYVRARGRALLGTVVVVFSLGAAASIPTLAAILTRSAPLVVVVVAAVPTFVAVTAAIIGGLYRFSVGRQLGFRGLLPGSLLASVCFTVVLGGFALYLRFSTRYTAVYGALAGTVIGMIGTYLGVYAVLLGAVLNAQLAAAQTERAPA
ncbi:MAG TPA: YihY/virulence factor BrkB family protein [Acidimicrobiia bacterium]|nr:YihY/virulence factor BrkB family protein [Acidimicrobiia bacterium]